MRRVDLTKISTRRIVPIRRRLTDGYHQGIYETELLPSPPDRCGPARSSFYDSLSPCTPITSPRKAYVRLQRSTPRVVRVSRCTLLGLTRRQCLFVKASAGPRSHSVDRYRSRVSENYAGPKSADTSTSSCVGYLTRGDVQSDASAVNTSGMDGVYESVQPCQSTISRNGFISLAHTASGRGSSILALIYRAIRAVIVTMCARELRLTRLLHPV